MSGCILLVLRVVPRTAAAIDSMKGIATGISCMQITDQFLQNVMRFVFPKRSTSVMLIFIRHSMFGRGCFKKDLPHLTCFDYKGFITFPPPHLLLLPILIFFFNGCFGFIVIDDTPVFYFMKLIFYRNYFKYRKIAPEPKNFPCSN